MSHHHSKRSPNSKVIQLPSKTDLRNFSDEEIMVEARVREGEEISKLQTPDWYVPSAQELRDWQEAVTLACSWVRPRRYKLNILYKNLMNDAHTLSVTESRILRVLRSQFRICDDKGKENPDLTALFKKPWFEKFLRIAMTSIFFGTTIIEVFEQEDNGEVKDVTMIPRGYVLPENGEILKSYWDNDGWKYREFPYNQYYIQVGETNDIGVFSHIAPVIIAKKYAIGSWSHYIEKMGIPFRWILTDSTDNARIKTLNEILKKMAGAGYAVLNTTEKMETMQPNQLGHILFKDFISVLNSEISKGIVGQDGTSDHKDSKGTYGALMVLQGVANDRHESDKNMIRNLVNYELIPRLINVFGYKLNGYHYDWSKTEDLEVGLFIEAVKDLSQNYDLDIKQITEKTGINVIGSKKSPTPGFPTAQKKKPRRLTLSLPLSEHLNIDHSPVAVDESQLKSIEDDILHNVFHDQQVFSPEYYDYLTSELNKALGSGWKNIAMTYSPVDESVQTMMEASIYRFSAAKDYAVLQQLNDLVRNSTTFDDFKGKAAELLGTYDGDYLRTEYNNAIASGQNAARYRDQVSKMDDLPYWQYVTAGDDRVREEHRALDHIILKADDPAWSQIYPPNGWGCRCEVVALDDIPAGMEVQDGDVPLDILKTTGVDKNGLSCYDRMKRDGFAINRGEVSTVFTENENYIRNFGAKMNIESSYGSDEFSWSNLDKSEFPTRIPVLKNEAEAQDWFDNLTGDNDYTTFKDQKGRSVQLSKDVFKHIDTDIVEFIPTILSDPDEVWVNGKGADQGITQTFIKFYEDDMLMINVSAYPDAAMDITAFKQGSDNNRKGLLVKRFKK